MEDYLIQNNNLYKNSDNQHNQRTNHYKDKKIKKYIACKYDWKEFYSDDEDNSYNYLNLNNNYINNKKKFKKARTLIQNSNINLSNKNFDKLKKSKTINKINKYKIYNNNKNNQIIISNKLNKISNKKVSFQAKNFVKYIDVESYKKYNILNTSTDSSLNSNNDTFADNEINNKVDLKCTCLIY